MRRSDNDEGEERGLRSVVLPDESGSADNLRKSGLGRRVRALGEVIRNRRGLILRVEVDQLEVLPDLRDAPSVDELAGIAPWYTGEQSTEEYLWSVRDP